MSSVTVWVIDNRPAPAGSVKIEAERWTLGPTRRNVPSKGQIVHQPDRMESITQSSMVAIVAQHPSTLESSVDCDSNVPPVHEKKEGRRIMLASQVSQVREDCSIMFVRHSQCTVLYHVSTSIEVGAQVFGRLQPSKSEQRLTQMSLAY